VWGERVAMKWLGVAGDADRAPQFLPTEGELGGDERISGKMRELVGD
jgi:hypothetical protein